MLVELYINGKTYFQRHQSLTSLLISIEANGLKEPLIIGPDGKIISGNERFLAYKILRFKEVGCIIKNFLPKETQ